MKPHLSEREYTAVTKLAEQLRTTLGANLVDLRLFGSKARGDYTSESDIDILVVLRHKDQASRDRIYEILLPIDLEYDPHISLAIFSEEELQVNEALGSPFTKHIKADGIPLS